MIRNPILRPRRGITSVLAMVYLVLFTVLAVGFYATTNIFSQVAANERRGVEAQLAVETGVDFMRNALYQVVVPADVTEANLLTEVNNDLQALLNPTGNFINKPVGLANGGIQIDVPLGNQNYVYTGAGGKFRADIKRQGRKLIVTVTGGSADLASAANTQKVRVEFEREERPTEFFKLGVASRGQIQVLTRNLVQGLPADHAKVLSLSTVNPPIRIGAQNPSGGSGVTGDLWVPIGTTPDVYPGWSVAGSTINADIMANHVHHMTADQMPTMPVPDTSIFKPFVAETYVAGKPLYKNIIIPGNLNPTISGPTTIQGVVYVQQPNKVTFNGNVAITGVVVTEDVGVGTLLTNTLVFAGNGGSKGGVEGLPDTPEWATLKRLAGPFIVAPGFDVQLTGNFGSISGHIAGDKVTLSGSSNSSITGSLVGLRSTVTIGGNTSATLVYDPNQGHAGLRFPDRYVPVVSSYEELR